MIGRYYIELEHEHVKQPTPKEVDVLKEVAGLVKSVPELVKIKHIYSGYGDGKSKIIAYVYDTEEAFKGIEVIKKKPKKQEEKAKPKKEGK